MRHPVPSDRLAEISAALADVSVGLDAAEVSERRLRFGANAIVDEPDGHWLELLRDTARDPMIWLLIGTGVLYALIGDRNQALILFAAIVPVVGMDAWLHRRTRVSTQGLRGRLASRSTVLRAGSVIVVPAVDLVPGDLVLLAAGESFPADGLIVGSAIVRRVAEAAHRPHP